MAWVLASYVDNPAKVYDFPGFFMDIAKISGTLLGFTITGLSIMVAFSGAAIINNLKKTGHFSDLTNALYIAATGFLISMITSIVSYFYMNMYFWVANMAVFVFSVRALIGAGRKFYLVIMLLGKPSGDPKYLD